MIQFKLKKLNWRVVGMALCIASASPVYAAGTAADAAKLGGPDFTPMGAERKANATGTIPEWTPLQGIPPGIAGVVSGKKYPDPYASEKPLFFISAANMDQYKDKLTPGQMALLKKTPSDKMPIYPTHRSCAEPPSHYQVNKENVLTAKLSADDEALSGVPNGGIPFPFPKTGAEAMWNHRQHFYAAAKSTQYYGGFIVNSDGSFEETKIREDVVFPYQLPKDKKEGMDGYSYLTKVTTLAPARRKNNILLFHAPLDQSVGKREGWLYLTALRRMLRGPDLEHDAPDPDAQGMATIDQRYMFSANLERYDWKIVGKTEKYIGYNAYKALAAGGASVEERGKFVGKTRLSSDIMRYELHRVWVVEGTVKPGQRHIYPKRTFYIDEDTWLIVLADMYDAQGKLWRTSETHMVNLYDIPSCVPAVRPNYDLFDDKYFIEQWVGYYDFTNIGQLNKAYFSPDSLRQGQR